MQQSSEESSLERTFFAQDWVDLQYAVKETAKGMANSKQSDWDKLVRLAKYLLGHKRYVMTFAIQRGVYSINCFGDSDFAGDATTRKSTSGGIMTLGDHVIKSWSPNQSVIALSRPNSMPSINLQLQAWEDRAF